MSSVAIRAHGKTLHIGAFEGTVTVEVHGDGYSYGHHIGPDDIYIDLDEDGTQDAIDALQDALEQIKAWGKGKPR